MERTRFELGSHVEAVSFIDQIPVSATAAGVISALDADGAWELARHGEAILSARTTRDGKGLVTGGEDGRVLLTGKDGESETLFEARGKWLDTLATGNEGALAVVVGREVVVLTRAGKGLVEKRLPLERSPAGLAFAPKGQRLAMAGVDKVLLSWTGTDAPAQTLEWKGAHLDVMFSPDGRYVISTMQEMALHGWRLGDGHHMRMTGYPAKIRSMAFTAKGKWLATSGAEAAILWPFLTKDGPSGKAPKELGVMPAKVSVVAPHPHDEVVALGYEDGQVLLVRIDDGAEVSFCPPGEGAVTALSWDDKGFRLIAGRESGVADLVVLGRG